MIEHSDANQSVVVYFRFAGGDLAPLYALEDPLATALEAAGAGTYDGHEIDLIDGDDAYLFMVGPDAERLFAAARPVLEGSPLLRGAAATLRFGSGEDAAGNRQVMLNG